MMNLIDGKSVAVVGNANSLLSTTFGAEIDSHDTVIRFNKAAGLLDPNRYKRSTGNKTDIWVINNYLWFAQLYNKYSHNVTCVVQINDFECPSDIVKYTENIHRLINSLGARPSSGIRVLDMLHYSDARQITVYGFDFKKTHTYYDLNKRTAKIEQNQGSPHDFFAEERYFFDVLAQNPKINLRTSK